MLLNPQYAAISALVRDFVQNSRILSWVLTWTLAPKWISLPCTQIFYHKRVTLMYGQSEVQNFCALASYYRDDRVLSTNVDLMIMERYRIALYVAAQGNEAEYKGDTVSQTQDTFGCIIMLLFFIERRCCIMKNGYQILCFQHGARPAAETFTSYRCYAYEVFIDGVMQGIVAHKLDRMLNAEETTTPLTPAEQFLGPNADLAINQYVQQSLFRYGGDKIHLVLETHDHMADELADNFGTEAKLQPQKDGTYRYEADVNDSNGLIYWLLQYADYVKVLEPESVKVRLPEKVEAIQKMYQ